ncbi:MAG: polyphosphate polymerase domain-containing protein [Actinomycetota bacterium]|nr:polyphosphate polymerase domain-containing protein [Actinomycetota bacterium]MDQ3647757.1 polyphosphate polymerase domain-containing protein [Actinomycetota bacterium]
MRTLTLKELDERASLQRRVDRKYLVPVDLFRRVVSELEDGYEVLEIDGERSFGYESIYFDTAELLCFRQHVEDERPRFKARTRLYAATQACVFEVKVKTADGTMDKRHLERSPSEHGKMDSSTRSFLDEVIGASGFDAVAEGVEPSLTTRFIRRTFAAREGTERVTCDSRVEMLRPDGSAAWLSDDRILVESKSEDGEGAWDEALARKGVEPVSLSKYRVGHSLLGADDPEEPLPPWGRRLFSVRAS